MIRFIRFSLSNTRLTSRKPTAMQSHTSTHQNRAASPSNNGLDASETLRNAYNAAFDELELGWHWGVSQFRELQHHDDERSRMQAYLSAKQPHLLKAYDVDFFVDAVQHAKTHYFCKLQSTSNLAQQFATA